jgi:hypothetical protein
MLAVARAEILLLAAWRNGGKMPEPLINNIGRLLVRLIEGMLIEAFDPELVGTAERAAHLLDRLTRTGQPGLNKDDFDDDIEF